MKFTLSLLLPILATIGLLAPSLDASDTGVRNGHVVGVVTAHGMPVPNAAVEIQIGNPNQHFVARTRTDARGRFVFRSVPPGYGELRAGHPRFGRAHLRFDLRPGEVERLHVQLH